MEITTLRGLVNLFRASFMLTAHYSDSTVRNLIKFKFWLGLGKQIITQLNLTHCRKIIFDPERAKNLTMGIRRKSLRSCKQTLD